jgi:hypothetical protein
MLNLYINPVLHFDNYSCNFGPSDLYPSNQTQFRMWYLSRFTGYLDLLTECEGTSCSFSSHHSDIQSPRSPISIVTWSSCERNRYLSIKEVNQPWYAARFLFDAGSMMRSQDACSCGSQPVDRVSRKLCCGSNDFRGVRGLLARAKCTEHEPDSVVFYVHFMAPLSLPFFATFLIYLPLMFIVEVKLIRVCILM